MERSERWARWRQRVALMLMLGLMLATLSPVQAQSDVRYFGQTGHYLRGAFRYFWESNGGITVFGYPITEEFRRSSDGRVVQYFERARFELTQQGTQYTVNLGNLGSEVTGGRTFPKVPPIATTRDRRYFPQTQHVVQYGFKTIFETYGGERVFGLPISEEIKEVIDDSEWHTVQYFEKARFEFWPQFAPGQRVLISTLGRRLAPPQLLPPLPPNAPPAGPVTEGNAPTPNPPATPAQVPPSVNATVTPPNGPPGTTFAFDAFNFEPGENVGIWLTAPNQATVGADFQAEADAQGSITSADIAIKTDTSFAEGIWSFNAQGVSSKRQAIGYFLISRTAGATAGNPANLGVVLHDQLPRQGQATLVPLAGPSGTPFFFQAGGFSADEQVSSWITFPDKQSLPVPAELLLKEGPTVLVEFDSVGFADGFYTIVVQGEASGVIAAANFKITSELVAPPSTPRPPSVNGSVTPAEGGGDTVFQLRGQGFQPNERLQFWTTQPDGTYVLFDEELVADAQGRIGYNPPLDLYGTDRTLPGVYGFHFRGKTGGVRVDLYLTFIGS